MKRIPVILVTGFLGAGKTEFLNNLLTEYSDERLAIVMNEFGEVGIDERLLLLTDEEVVEMNNGAICCAVRGDTQKVLLKLVENRDKEIDRVVIETTGLANPVPIARMFFEKPALREKFELDLIVTVVDASNIVAELDDTAEAKVQLMSADVVLLNKSDLVGARELAEARMYIRNINPLAVIHETVKSKIGLAELTKSDAAQTFVQEFSHDGEHSHHDDVQSFVLESRVPLDLAKVSRWIGEMLILNGEKLMRYKGILDIAGREKRFVFQGVHMYFENREDRDWREGEERVSQVVVIGRDINREEFARSFSACGSEIT